MDIHKSYIIAAPREAVWVALTQPEAIESWGGDVHGTVVEVDPGFSMLQEWYSGDWDAPSLATFTLSDEPGGGTRLELDNTDVPDHEAADVDAGWDDYYLSPIKKLLETQGS